MVILPEFGARSKLAILRRYPTLAAYAHDCAWDVSTVTKMTRHGRVPPLERLLQMREKLGVSLEWLLFGLGLGVSEAVVPEEFPSWLQELLWFMRQLSDESQAALRTIVLVLASRQDAHQSWQQMLIHAASAIEAHFSEGLQSDRAIAQRHASP